MTLGMSPAIWQQFKDNVFENIPNRERYKIIMDYAIIFNTPTAFLRLSNLSQSYDEIWIQNFTPWVPIFKDHLTYMDLTFMLKDGKPSYIP